MSIRISVPGPIQGPGRMRPSFDGGTSGHSGLRGGRRGRRTKLIPKQPEEHAWPPGCAAMILEARAFEPLCQDRMPGRVRCEVRLGQRLAKERQ